MNYEKRAEIITHGFPLKFQINKRFSWREIYLLF